MNFNDTNRRWYGQVNDDTTGPVTGASVTLHDIDSNTFTQQYTDSEGWYEFRDMNIEHTYEISQLIVTYPGHDTGYEQTFPFALGNPEGNYIKRHDFIVWICG